MLALAAVLAVCPVSNLERVNWGRTDNEWAAVVGYIGAKLRAGAFDEAVACAGRLEEDLRTANGLKWSHLFGDRHRTIDESDPERRAAFLLVLGLFEAREGTHLASRLFLESMMARPTAEALGALRLYRGSTDVRDWSTRVASKRPWGKGSVWTVEVSSDGSAHASATHTELWVVDEEGPLRAVWPIGGSLHLSLGKIQSSCKWAAAVDVRAEAISVEGSKGCGSPRAAIRIERRWLGL